MRKINFQNHIIRQQITSRGGGVEISLSKLGFPGEKMAAYQNYLGGGLLGAVCVNDTIRARYKFVELSTVQRLDNIGAQLKEYYFNLTNPDAEWEHQTFEQNQRMPASAY